MPKGDHIFIHRSWFFVFPYEHHGIDCGDGRVIHYDGNVVCRVALGDFSQGEEIHYKYYRSGECLDPEQTVALAKSRLGESLYDPRISNCEHFATWCKTGKWESEQVNKLPFLGDGEEHNKELRKILKQKEIELGETRLRLSGIQSQNIREAEKAALKTDLADYWPLSEALEQKRWQEADELTRSLMLKVGRANNAYFQATDVSRFPRKDLLIIDRIWRNHSQSHFGFITQKDIYERLGGTKDFCNDTYERECIPVLQDSC